MKIQDLAHQIVMRTMELLEIEQHYKIPEDTRKKVARQVRTELNDIIQKAG